MGSDITMLIIFGVVVLGFGIALLVTKVKEGKNNKVPANSTSSTDNGSYKKNSTQVNVPKEDIFNFMEFDKIQDNMIIQQKGEKYTAVIKCKGINYSLMSEVEQLSVEEGFMTFLNTLKFPVQLYVQAQTINLKSNIADYKENLKGLHEEYEQVNSNYSAVVNSLESTDEEIEQAEDKKNSVLNVLEYGQDIVKYVEKLALNKNMLQRSFYVLVSYYKSELSNASDFNKEELLDICYSELFTRVENIISGLSMCSVTGTPLNSNEIAELLYSAYNRDDKNYMSVQQALESGFYRLYSTSEDAITKKNKKLVENIREEAEYKALVALNKAIEEGSLITKSEAEDAYDQETSKQAIEIIKREKLPDDIKQSAKKIIIEDYKKSKKERIEKEEQEIAKAKETLKAINGETIENSKNDTEQEIIVSNQDTDTDKEDAEDTIV